MNRAIKEFWRNDLVRLSVPLAVRNLLPKETVAFLETVGLPGPERIQYERREYVIQTTLFHDQITGKDISGLQPLIIFARHIREIVFEGRKYLSISYSDSLDGGKSGVALEEDSGRVFYIFGEAPSYIARDYPFVSIRYMNESIDRCLYMLTEDFATKRLIMPHQIRIKQLTLTIMQNMQKRTVSPPSLKEWIIAENEAKCILIKELDERMRNFEPDAFADTAYYWRYYMDELISVCKE